MYDQGMQNGSRRQGKSVLGSRVEKKPIQWPPTPQPRPQGFSLKKWVGREKALFPPHPFFEGKALGTRLPTPGFQM